MFLSQSFNKQLIIGWISGQNRENWPLWFPRDQGDIFQIVGFLWSLNHVIFKMVVN